MVKVMHYQDTNVRPVEVSIVLLSWIKINFKPKELAEIFKQYTILSLSTF